MPIGLHTGNKDIANLKLTRAGDDVILALDGAGIVMAGSVMADGDNIGAQFQRFVARHQMVVRVGNYRSQAALDQAKTRKSVPGNLPVD